MFQSNVVPPYTLDPNEQFNEFFEKIGVEKFSAKIIESHLVYTVSSRIRNCMFSYEIYSEHGHVHLKIER